MRPRPPVSLPPEGLKFIEDFRRQCERIRRAHAQPPPLPNPFGPLWPELHGLPGQGVTRDPAPAPHDAAGRITHCKGKRNADLYHDPSTGTPPLPVG